MELWMGAATQRNTVSNQDAVQHSHRRTVRSARMLGLLDNPRDVAIPSGTGHRHERIGPSCHRAERQVAAGAAGVLGIELTKTAGAVVTDLVDGTFTVEASPVHA